MKSFILTSITLAMLLSAAGCSSSEDSCCDGKKSLNQSTLIPQVKEQINETVIATSPLLGPTAIAQPITPIINFNDGEPIVSGEKYTFDCNSSIAGEMEDNNNSSEIVQCDWEIHSFDNNGNPYVDCSIQNVSVHAVHICEIATKIVTTLTVTDSNGNSSSTTQEYNITKP